jgi:hypothetical protein
MAHFSWR